MLYKGTFLEETPMSTEARNNLSEFATTQSEGAFRKVVTEFGGLVLASAQRRTDDPQLAEEIAQNVFAVMARKAEQLSKHQSLAGWVFTTTRLESAKALRGRRRHRRKLQALAAEINQGTDMSDEELEHWREALPHLEEGLDRLSDTDRDAVLARFFENKTFGQIATETGRSEAACKMRVHRSLEKLRGWMANRGVTLSATAIATGLGAEWTQAAPAASIINSISTNAVAAAPTLGTGTIFTNTLLTMNAAKSASIAVATVLVAAAIPLAIQQSKANRLESEFSQLGTPRPFESDKPPLNALGKPSAITRSNPGMQMLRDASLPKDPEDLTAVLVGAVEEQNLGALMRAMVALDRMDQAEISELITKISESDMHLGKKQAARRMLIAFMDTDETDGAALLDKALDSDIQLFHTLRNRLARWAENDPKGAADWIQSNRDNPKLKVSTGSNPVGDLIRDALLTGMARTDPAVAISHLENIDPVSQWTTHAAVAGSIVGRGQEGDLELAREVILSLPPDRISGGISVASQQRMNGNRLDAFAQFARSFGLPDKYNSSDLYWLATSQVEIPAVERADWVLENLGAQNPSSLRNFVSNTRRQESELGAWIAGLPAGEFGDNALRGEISTLVYTFNDGGAAITSARMISDDEMRQEALRFIVGRIPGAVHHAPAASNAQEASELSAAEASPTKPGTPGVPATR